MYAAISGPCGDGWQAWKDWTRPGGGGGGGGGGEGHPRLGWAWPFRDMHRDAVGTRLRECQPDVSLAGPAQTDKTGAVICDIKHEELPYGSIRHVYSLCLRLVHYSVSRPCVNLCIVCCFELPLPWCQDVSVCLPNGCALHL